MPKLASLPFQRWRNPATPVSVLAPGRSGRAFSVRRRQVQASRCSCYTALWSRHEIRFGFLYVCLPKTRALITQSNDTTFGFALSIVLTFLSNTLGPDSPFAPYLFLRKAAFQHFDEAKKDGISHTARFVKGACPNQCKRGLLQGRLLPVVYTSQRHFCLFLPSYLSRLPPPDG